MRHLGLADQPLPLRFVAAQWCQHINQRLGTRSLDDALLDRQSRRSLGADREKLARQAAAGEVFQKLVVGDKREELVGGFVGGKSPTLNLTPEEQKKLKALLQSL